MTHGSLFSGIGGFDLAAQWMGWENKFHCEWNPFGQKVLKYYWNEAESFKDITKTDFTKYANRIDILTGGFPCQPYSLAGKRKGKEDDRHLFPEMLRAIREIKPRWVVGENVFGLVNWNGGLVFHEVQSDLEAEGYEVFPYVLPAASVGAPHRRDRVWFVAYSKNDRCGRWEGKECTISERKLFQRKQGWNKMGSQIERCNRKWNATNTSDERLERCENGRIIENSRKKSNKQFARCFCTTWENFPTVSPICNGDDGLSDRLDSITFSKWRNESIKAGGNAIVPQVVYQIFKAIELYERGTAL